MKLNLYSVQDIKSKTYQLPVASHNHETAIRTFGEFLRNPNNPASKYPQDFRLFYIGCFDDDTGIMEPAVPLEQIIDGQSFETIS